MLIEELLGKRARMTTPPAPPSELATTFAELSKARDLLGYEPAVPVHDGIKLFWEWYQSTVLGHE